MPGLISWKALPGGGTTDYAVEIFYEAIKTGKYVSFLGPDTSLPMMFMDDAVRSIIELMTVPMEKIKNRMSYNITAINFTVKDLADEIKKHIPDFEIGYKPDFRQQIADSWPDSIDDSEARNDWGWKHEVGIEKLVVIML